MIYDVGLVLAKGLDKNLKLDEESKDRTDLGIELFRERKVNNLLMSGGHEDLGEKYGVSIAEVMKNLAVLNNVPEKAVFKEELSLESVGQLIFSKILIDKFGWKSIIIVSQDYHIKRLREISKVVFGDKYKIDFLSGKSNFSKEKEVIEREEKSINSFKKTFGDIHLNSNKDLLEILLNKHPIYNKNKDVFEYKIKQ